MTKPVRTRLSPEKRKSQLLDNASDLVVTSGLQNFTIEALAKAAGVTVPLVYNYFSGRTELLQELLKREYRNYVSDLSRLVSDAQTFEEVVRISVQSNFDYYANANALSILQSQPELNTAIEEQQKKASLRSARFLVEKTAESYQLTTKQAELVLTMSSGASISAAQYASATKLNKSETVDLVVTYILSGLSEIVVQNKQT
jgi:AcrR family transcriptional regulator